MGRKPENSGGTARRGKPFPKGVSGNPGGRPKKSVQWSEAEASLREAIPRLMMLTKNELRLLLEANPTGAEMLAAKYIHEHVPATVERFLGKTPTVLSGVDGKPLVPEAPAPILPPLDLSKLSDDQIERLIEATATANRQAAIAAAPPPAPAPAAAEPPPPAAGA